MPYFIKVSVILQSQRFSTTTGSQRVLRRNIYLACSTTFLEKKSEKLLILLLLKIVVVVQTTVNVSHEKITITNSESYQTFGKTGFRVMNRLTSMQYVLTLLLVF